MSPRKTIDISESIVKTHPEILKEWDFDKNIRDPKEITYGSGVKVWWLCQNKHSFEQKIFYRTTKNFTCPQCRSLSNTHKDLIKEWDYEKNSIHPTEVSHGSQKKVWWICPEKHSYFSKISNRTSFNKRGCPYCSGQKVGFGNDLASTHKKLLKEWDYEKNTLSPKKVTYGSRSAVWWRCKKSHSWKSRINTRTNLNTGCPYCSGKKVGYGNDLGTRHPNIIKEWDYEKNKLKPNQYTFSSQKEVWWLCDKGHSYYSRISNRTSNNKSGCPYCSGQKVGFGNDLASTHKKLLKEWDYEKNTLSPKKVTYGSSKQAWWLCDKGHSWKTTVGLRTISNTSCPYCTLRSRSKEEIYLLFELKCFFNIDEDDHKVKLNKIFDVDIKIPIQKIIIEYDGHYWHDTKEEKDIKKTKILQKNGWTVIRVREKPLKILSRKYNVSSNKKQYKETSNKVLKKISNLGFEINEIEKYLNRKTLKNKKNADSYLKSLLEEYK